MIPSLTLILLCQLAGEAAARAAGWPLPGPVLGMAILLALLLLNDAAPSPLDAAPVARTADALLANLSLLFVPAGVGVVGRLDVLAAHGAGLAAALVASTLLGLIATALTFAAVARRLEGRGA